MLLASYFIPKGEWKSEKRSIILGDWIGEKFLWSISMESRGEIKDLESNGVSKRSDFA